MNSADCQQTWQQLVNGTTRILDTFTTQSHAYLVVAASETPTVELNERRLKIFEQILLGTSAKATAYDFGVSQPTVAMEVKLALSGFGVHGSTSKIPLALTMLLHGAKGMLPVTFEREHRADVGKKPCDVLRALFANLTLLPPAVREVVFLCAQGRSHAQIAARRRTSTRTVANQMATAFNRLGVSGRAGVLGYLSLAPRAG